MDTYSIYINPANQKAAGEFVNGFLWAEFKRALLNRRPPAPEPKDPSHVSAGRGLVRSGYEQCLAEIEKLPFEVEQVAQDPFKTPALFVED